MTKHPVARKHHFVPAFLLAGFTPNGNRESELCVTDLETGKRFPGTPETTGYVTNLNTVVADGHRPDFIESGYLSLIEGRAAPVIADLLRDRQMPTGEAYAHLIA